MTRARGPSPGSTLDNPWVTILEFMASEPSVTLLEVVAAKRPWIEEIVRR